MDSLDKSEELIKEKLKDFVVSYVRKNKFFYTYRIRRAFIVKYGIKKNSGRTNIIRIIGAQVRKITQQMKDGKAIKRVNNSNTRLYKRIMDIKEFDIFTSSIQFTYQPKLIKKTIKKKNTLEDLKINQSKADIKPGTIDTKDLKKFIIEMVENQMLIRINHNKRLEQLIKPLKYEYLTKKLQEMFGKYTASEKVLTEEHKIRFQIIFSIDI